MIHQKSHFQTNNWNNFESPRTLDLKIITFVKHVIWNANDNKSIFNCMLFTHFYIPFYFLLLNPFQLYFSPLLLSHLSSFNKLELYESCG